MIEELHISALLSPLHDHDLDKMGVLKKPHYHFMVMYESPHTDRQFMSRIVEPLCGAGAAMLESRRGYARYLCHLDNPGKYVYDTSQVVSYCGVDYYSLINSSSDNLEVLREIFSYVHAHPRLYYSDLLDYALAEKPVWFALLMSHQSQYVLNYFRSYRYSYSCNVGKD